MVRQYGELVEPVWSTMVVVCEVCGMQHGIDEHRTGTV
jgi:hypothetical protein